MDSEKFKIFYIDNGYLTFLQKNDSKVPQKKDRPFVGIVLKINNYKYYAPLSSPKKKHLKMKNTGDLFKIKQGKLGVINLNNMIPVTNIEKQLILIDISALKEKDDKYAKLLLEQLHWCNRNRASLIKRATSIYNRVISNNTNSCNIKLRQRSCDFKALEQASNNYNLMQFKKKLQKEYSASKKRSCEFEKFEKASVKYISHKEKKKALDKKHTKGRRR